MSNILPRKADIQAFQERFESSDHTEADFESLLKYTSDLLQALEDEKVKNLSLEIDTFFARGGQIPNQ